MSDCHIYSYVHVLCKTSPMFIGDFTPPPFKQRLWRWSDRALDYPPQLLACIHITIINALVLVLMYLEVLASPFWPLLSSQHQHQLQHQHDLVPSTRNGHGLPAAIITIRYPAKPQPIAVNTAIAHCTAKISISAALHHDNLQPFRILHREHLQPFHREHLQPFHREHLQPFHRRIDILPPTTSNISKHQI